MNGSLVRLKQLLPAPLRLGLQRLLHRTIAVFLAEPYRSVLPYTMMGLKRLRMLDYLAHRIDELGIAGDVVECGVCNGGSGALLASVACRSSHRRHTWLLDSFAGLPAAGPKDGALAAAYTGLCRGSVASVRQALAKVAVTKESVTLVPGWFHETVPTLPVRRIALLHIDADWYESVHVILCHLFDKMAPGGFVVIDDFDYWQGCQRAYDDFFGEGGFVPKLIPVDGMAVYFQIPPIR
jgi:O-methyltransferase